MPYQVAGRDLVDRANRRRGILQDGHAVVLRRRSASICAGPHVERADTAGAPPVAVINETFAKREFADVDPIGQRLLVQQIIPGQTGLGEEIGWEIVGVIADEKIGGLDDTGSGGMYVSYRQSPAYGMRLAVRARDRRRDDCREPCVRRSTRQQGSGVEPRAARSSRSSATRCRPSASRAFCTASSRRSRCCSPPSASTE